MTTVQISVTGVCPSSRRAAASTVVANRWIVIHGGFDGTKCLCDTYVLDTHEMSWKILKLEKGCKSTSQTGPRALHTISSLAHGLFIFGGASNNRILKSSYLLFNSAVRNGIKTAKMLLASQAEAAALQESVITAELEASMLKDALQSVKQEAEVQIELAAHKYTNALRQPSLSCSQHVQVVTSHREMYQKKHELAVSAIRTLQKKLQVERDTCAKWRQNLHTAQEQYSSCQKSCTRLQAKLQAGIHCSL